LTEALGPLTYSEDEEEVFLGRSVTQHKHVSDETSRKIDIEIRNIVDTAHKTATDLVLANREKLEIMTEALMKYETIDASQIDQIMEGKVPDPPEDWDDSDSDGGKKDKSESASDSSESSGDSPSLGGTAEQH
jgi:cell division protease FtsH